mmetsp:Transcript_40643/g.115062  ORF Transcript_40643/g.115062 Transcript_40643/m.115062 type:complete len:271 (-) Transcript_40643:607-1419(-)
MFSCMACSSISSLATRSVTVKSIMPRWLLLSSPSSSTSPSLAAPAVAASSWTVRRLLRRRNTTFPSPLGDAGGEQLKSASSSCACPPLCRPLEPGRRRGSFFCCLSAAAGGTGGASSSAVDLGDGIESSSKEMLEPRYRRLGAVASLPPASAALASTRGESEQACSSCSIWLPRPLDGRVHWALVSCWRSCVEEASVPSPAPSCCDVAALPPPLPLGSAPLLGPSSSRSRALMLDSMTSCCGFFGGGSINRGTALPLPSPLPPPPCCDWR